MVSASAVMAHENAYSRYSENKAAALYLPLHLKRYFRNYKPPKPTFREIILSDKAVRRLSVLLLCSLFSRIPENPNPRIKSSKPDKKHIISAVCTDSLTDVSFRKNIYSVSHSYKKSRKQHNKNVYNRRGGGKNRLSERLLFQPKL